jgi:hypothetical protein
MRPELVEIHRAPFLGHMIINLLIKSPGIRQEREILQHIQPPDGLPDDVFAYFDPRLSDLPLHSVPKRFFHFSLLFA